MGANPQPLRAIFSFCLVRLYRNNQYLCVLIVRPLCCNLLGKMECIHITKLYLVGTIGKYRELTQVLVILFILFSSGCQTINEPVFGGTVSDVDGNLYHTVTIGNQTWMIENLRTTHYSDSSVIPMITDSAAWRNLKTPGYCWYNNDSVKYENTYGALYNWYAADTGLLAPTGWHIPTQADWTTLENNVSIYLYTSGSLSKILASSVSWLKSGNTGAIGNLFTLNNSSGFNALAGGSRENYNKHSFNSIDTLGGWWSSTVKTDTSALCMTMKYNLSTVDRYYKHKWNGFSVRCIKNSN